MTKKKYIPPKSGKDAPKELKHILDTVYSNCREYHPGEIKERKALCSQIAWAAAEKKFKKVKGKWKKKKGK